MTKTGIPTSDECLLNRTEAAERLRVKAQTLANWAIAGQGPKFLKLGRAVRYRPQDLRQWLSQCEVATR